VLIYDIPTTRGSKADLPKWVEQQFRERGIAATRIALIDARTREARSST